MVRQSEEALVNGELGKSASGFLCRNAVGGLNLLLFVFSVLWEASINQSIHHVLLLDEEEAC